MYLYKLNKNSTLEEVKLLPFKLEKDIQTLVEINLQCLFGIQLIKSEFQLNGLRIDTLGFDTYSKSFVIIEYKKGKSFSVIDQGYSYLSLLLNNKADFILEYLEKRNKSLKKNDVDWSQSRVIFISTQFTNYQKQSIEFKDLPFELWEIKKYSNNSIILNQHKSSSEESIKNISPKDEKTKQVNKEIIVYSEDSHLTKGSEATRELAAEVKERILEFENIEMIPVKFYIGFKVNKKLIADFEVQRSKLRLRINLKKGQLDDPKNVFRDVSNIGTFGVGDYEAVITPESDLDYIMSCVKQSYKIHTLLNT